VAVAASLAGVAYSTALTSPAVQDFISRHPGDAAYIDLVVAVSIAVWHAWATRSGSVLEPPSTGSQTMGAK